VERALQLAVVAAYIAHEKSGKRKEFKQLLLQGMQHKLMCCNLDSFRLLQDVLNFSLLWNI
jgi:hypothetical protein